MALWGTTATGNASKPPNTLQGVINKVGDAEDRLWSLLESTLGDIKRSVKAIDRQLKDKLDKRDLDAITNMLTQHDKRIERLEEEERERDTEIRTAKHVEDRASKLRRWAFQASLSILSTAAILISAFK